VELARAPLNQPRMDISEGVAISVAHQFLPNRSDHPARRTGDFRKRRNREAA
jgi:hypothetical protein